MDADVHALVPLAERDFDLDALPLGPVRRILDGEGSSSAEDDGFDDGDGGPEGGLRRRWGSGREGRFGDGVGDGEFVHEEGGEGEPCCCVGGLGGRGGGGVDAGAESCRDCEHVLDDDVECDFEGDEGEQREESGEDPGEAWGRRRRLLGRWFGCRRAGALGPGSRSWRWIGAGEPEFGNTEADALYAEYEPCRPVRGVFGPAEAERDAADVERDGGVLCGGRDEVRVGAGGGQPRDAGDAPRRDGAHLDRGDEEREPEPDEHAQDDPHRERGDTDSQGPTRHPALFKSAQLQLTDRKWTYSQLQAQSLSPTRLRCDPEWAKLAAASLFSSRSGLLEIKRVLTWSYRVLKENVPW